MAHADFIVTLNLHRVIRCLGCGCGFDHSNYTSHSHALTHIQLYIQYAYLMFIWAKWKQFLGDGSRFRPLFGLSHKVKAGQITLANEFVPKLASKTKIAY